MKRAYYRVYLQPGSLSIDAFYNTRVLLVHNGRDISGRVPICYAERLIRAAEEGDARKIPVLLFATNPPKVTYRTRRRPFNVEPLMEPAWLRVVA